MSTAHTPTIIPADELKEELVKANLTEAIITGLQTKWDAINTKIENIDQYNVIDRMRKDVKGYRLAGEKIFEHEIAERHKMHKEAIAKKKEVLSPILQIEEQTKARIFEYEMEQEAIAREKEAARARAIQERHNLCLEMGFALRDGVWIQGDTGIDAEDVLKADDAKWMTLKAQMGLVFREAEDRRVAAEEAAKELERKEAELREREAAVKKAEDDARYRVNMERARQMMELGMTLSNEQLTCHNQHPVEPFTLSYGAAELFQYSEEDWMKELGRAKGAVDERTATTRALKEKADKEAAIAKAAEDARIREEERKRIEQAAKDKEVADKADQAERIARLGDAEVIRSFMNIIKEAGSGAAVISSEATSVEGIAATKKALADLKVVYGDLARTMSHLEEMKK